METRSPQFQSWSIALKLEMDYLLFLRWIRNSNFAFYVVSISLILPWIFAFTHIHYAYWLASHHYDMEMLHKTNPDIFYEFKSNGDFTVRRTKAPFSAMGLDQRHE